MKLIIHIFLIFFYFSLNAQSNKIAFIEYQYSTYFGDKVSQVKSRLICSNSQSIFQIFSESQVDTKTDEVEGGNVHKYTNNKDSYYLFDLSEIFFSFTGDIDKNVYEIKEDIPKMKWVLSQKPDDKKVINGLNCNKALLNFRGRNFIAWYTSKIPISFGPWKFNGLPGLILEVYDIDNNFMWKATKILYPSNEKIDMNIIEKLKVKKISLKEFVERYENSIKVKQNILLGRLPRGVKASSVTLTRHSIELSYEWETKNSGNK